MNASISQRMSQSDCVDDQADQDFHCSLKYWTPFTGRNADFRMFIFAESAVDGS